MAVLLGMLPWALRELTQWHRHAPWSLASSLQFIFLNTYLHFVYVGQIQGEGSTISHCWLLVQPPALLAWTGATDCHCLVELDKDHTAVVWHLARKQSRSWPRRTLLLSLQAQKNPKIHGGTPRGIISQSGVCEQCMGVGSWMWAGTARGDFWLPAFDLLMDVMV